MNKTLDLQEQLGFMGWAVAAGHYAPELKGKITDLVDRLVDDQFSAEFIALLNKIPSEECYTKELLMACSANMIEFCHMVSTRDEFMAIMDLEYWIFSEFCKMGDSPAEPFEQHIKDMSPKIAQDYLATKAANLTDNLDGLSGALFRALLASKMGDLLPEIAETFVTGEFFAKDYKHKEMVFTGQDIKLVVPDKEEVKSDEDDDWGAFE